RAIAHPTRLRTRLPSRGLIDREYSAAGSAAAVSPARWLSARAAAVASRGRSWLRKELSPPPRLPKRAVRVQPVLRPLRQSQRRPPSARTGSAAALVSL